MSNEFKSSQIINGTFGRLWVNNLKFANVKSVEAKVAGEYDDIDVSESTGKHRKLNGWEGSGTIVLHKIDTRLQREVSEGFKKGIQPDFKAITELADPAAKGYEQVELLGITFDEVALAKWEVKKSGEVELPFKFSDFNWLNSIA